MRCAHCMWTVFAFVLLNYPATPLDATEPKMDADALVVQHLNAIGSAEARAAVKTRVVRSLASYRVLVGGSGQVNGQMGLVTDAGKVRFMLKLAERDYKGENFAFDGDQVQAAFSNSSHSRSAFANFMVSQDAILREGLLGGVLSTNWALLDLAGKKAKLEYKGIKKVDGRQAHEVRYRSPKTSDLEISLYFDSETLHHVKTLYSLSIGSSMAHDSLSAVRNNSGESVSGSNAVKPDHTTLEERFSDFKTVDGLSVPTHWTLEFTLELPNGVTTVSQWDLPELKVMNNLGIDPLNFKVQ